MSTNLSTELSQSESSDGTSLGPPMTQQEIDTLIMQEQFRSQAAETIKELQDKLLSRIPKKAPPGSSPSKQKMTSTTSSLGTQDVSVLMPALKKFDPAEHTKGLSAKMIAQANKLIEGRPDVKRWTDIFVEKGSRLLITMALETARVDDAHQWESWSVIDLLATL